MEPPTEPTKPAESEADVALAASAANAVEQWRTYQNAYQLYQQQQAAYEQYMTKQATLTNPDEQAVAYNQYLAAHQSYQQQLEQYEQQKYYQEYYATGGQVAGPATMVAPPGGFPAAQITYQPPPVMPVPPAYSTPLANVDPFYKKNKDHYRDRSNLKRRSETYEKKAKVYEATNFYANPEDEHMLPADLKALFKDLECGLCVSKMNSHISANVHYQSKVHERKIVQWLKEWCETTGTPMPVRTRRKNVEVEPVGPNSLRCEACDLPLTSVQHANQHYTGKRHQMVVRGKKNPAGRGYFNEDGTWTRTPNDAPSDDRFGIGQSFRNKDHYNARDAKKMKLEPPPSPPKELLGPTPTTTTTTLAPPVYNVPATPIYGAPPATPLYGVPPVTPIYQPPPTVAVAAAPVPAIAQTAYPPPQVAPIHQPPLKVQSTVEEEIQRKESADCVDETGVFCLVCQIGVTSKTVMETHLKGVKHLKRLKMVGRMAPRTGSTTESILDTLHKPPQQNDWSLYRMPSGKYYCKSCNSIMADEKLFSQHWYGKKHKLKVKQEMDELAGSNEAEPKQKFYNRRPFGKNRFAQSQGQ